jgi:hypothetical protein
MNMKNTFTFLLIVFSLHAYAQQGKILIEGTAGFSKSNSSLDGTNNETIYKTASFSPRIGVFTSDRLLVGGGLSYQFSRQESQYISGGQYTNTMNQYGINIFVREFFPLGEKVFVTASGILSLEKGKQEAKGETSTSESDIFQYGVSVVPGLTYFLNDRWALTATLGSLYYKFTETEYCGAFDGKENTTDYGLSLNFNTFTVGVQYFIKKKE